MEILLYIVAVIGFTHIVVDGKIFEPIRNLANKILPEFISTVLSCYQCSGFWIGLICGWACFPGINPFQIVMAGFGGSFLANFAAILFNYIESRTMISLPDESSK